jgi:lysozyme
MTKRALLASIAVACGALYLLGQRGSGAAVASSPEHLFSGLIDGATNVVDEITAAIAPSPLSEQNIAAFLASIRAAEGTGGPNGYYTLFGGDYFLEIDTHPAVRTYGEFLAPGVQDYTTAAGAYQITFTTWRRLAAKLGLTDFSPATQDLMARELIREAGALGLVQAGRFDAAVSRVNGTWASLPGAPYPTQKQRSGDFVRAAYQAAGGAVAA